MSFSGQIKEELQKIISPARHCQMAEISAIMQFCGHIDCYNEDEKIIRLQTENKAVARKCFTLWKKTFNIYSSILVRQSSVQSGGMTYVLQVTNPAEAEKLIEALKLDNLSVTNGLLLKNSCCKRAFLRGAYLAAGSMSDPYKGYHLEYVCSSKEQARQLIEILQDFSLDAKMVIRKKYYVVYMKEGENISDLLNVMEAHVALMEFENTRIYKGMRNMINRKVNCEAANITKTVNAANKQLEDIEYIRQHYGLDNLPEHLRQIAYARFENPEAALGELGRMLDPPVGKSGVNHRLRKLGEFAKGLKE